MNKQQPEHQQGIDPFDYPMSYSWRAYYEETFYGRYLPEIDAPIRQEEPIVKTKITMILDKKALELQNRIVALEDNLRSLSDKKKRRDVI